MLWQIDFQTRQRQQEPTASACSCISVYIWPANTHLFTHKTVTQEETGIRKGLAILASCSMILACSFLQTTSVYGQTWKKEYQQPYNSMQPLLTVVTKKYQIFLAQHNSICSLFTLLYTAEQAAALQSQYRLWLLMYLTKPTTRCTQTVFLKCSFFIWGSSHQFVPS